MFFKIFLLLTGVLLTMSAYSQCKIERHQINSTESIYDKVVGRYMYYSPSFNFSHDGGTSTMWNVKGRPVSFNQKPRELNTIILIAKANVMAFSGKQFYKDIEFYAAGKIYPDSLAYFKSKGHNLKPYHDEVRYWMNFKLSIDSITYIMPTVFLDSAQKVVKTLFLPAAKNYKRVIKNVNYCELFAIAQKTRKNDYPLKEIYLTFDELKKQYYWRIVQIPPHVNATAVDYPVTKINAADFSDVELTYQTISIADGIPVIVKPLKDRVKD